MPSRKTAFSLGVPSLVLAACSGSSHAPASATSTSDGGASAALDAQDYQMAMTALDIPAGAELYKCQDYVNPFGKDIGILRSESIMTPGSHHFAAFRITGLTAAPMRDCPAGGLESHEFIHASQQLDQVTTYPPGVGRFLPATDGLRLMVHYINASGQTLHANPAQFSMRYVDANQISVKAGGVFLNNIGISVPPGASSATKSYTLTADIKLLVAVSHMHEHAVGFTSSTSDGRTLFTTTEWSEPRAAQFDPAMDIASGTTITWSCSYQNDTGQTLTFGESASQNEMCIFNGVYYPAPNGSSLVENLP